MYKGKRVIAITGGYNEEGKIGKVINKIPFYVDEIVAIDDGSADNTQEEIKKTKATLLINKKNMGAGFVLRKGMGYAIAKNYDIAVCFLDLTSAQRARLNKYIETNDG